MDEIIKKLQNRRSVREFTGEKVKDEDLELILRTAQRCPNSTNTQQISLIVVRDRETIIKLAELSGGQKHIETSDVFILILIDYHRAVYAAESTGNKIVVPETMNGLLVGAIDAGIMLNAIQTAAEVLGYGTTAIGAVRFNPDIICEMFGLPEYLFPVLGTTIGVPAENKLKSPKPRVPFESFVFEEKYDSKKVEKGVEDFENEYRKWWDENGLPEMPSYKQSILNYYSVERYKKIKDVLIKQGFKF